jgi:hypothetical protein
MLWEILLGAGVSICNIVIQALVMTGVVKVVHRVTARHAGRHGILLIAVMVATVSC